MPKSQELFSLFFTFFCSVTYCIPRLYAMRAGRPCCKPLYIRGLPWRSVLSLTDKQVTRLASVGISTSVHCHNLSALPSPIILAVYTLIVTPYCLKDILAVSLSPKAVVHGTILHIQNIRVATSMVSPLGLCNLATPYPIGILGYSGLRHSLELVKLCEG